MPSTPFTASEKMFGCELSVMSSKSLIWTKSSLLAYRGRALIMASPLASDRVAPRTLMPRLSSWSTTWAPMKPVAPVTRTYCLCAGQQGGTAFEM